MRFLVDNESIIESIIESFFDLVCVDINKKF